MPNCTYVTEPTRCDDCGFLIEPVAIRVPTGWGFARTFLQRGIVHKLGGRGLPERNVCSVCYVQPRIAPSVQRRIA